LTQLAVGDYVVHLLHGVGRYAGMTKLAVKGVAADFALLEYQGRDKLYLPVHRIHEIERYTSAESGNKAPKLDKLGGTTFANKTKKIKREVRQLAEELLQIYAQREALDGHSFAAPDEHYAEFEATFPFEETPDQHDAISAVQGDLGSDRPMDRLVCGDVGFGKTEVALRAAFRVANAGKQVAILAPTTVLVQQHYLTFSDRMSAFPLRVGVLNRFTPPKVRRATVEGIADGSIDVVVGTHRLLSKDVRFKDLGLVVIDEEQRFGVAQKERFKRLKTQVDMLTLTATPIPRTLHMGLLGLREISMITTPPSDRLAVRTYVTRRGNGIIEEGIRRELDRGGQVFYVVPRVLGIEEHALRIRELLPDARVVVAHGQMPAELLEKTMFDFLEHRADVLVATTIIESGLDIPRANTMFIAQADMFGLAQLYQLRGRIGRSKVRAHCYLMVNSLEKLSPEAKRRLESISRNSELGSGFNVASQDLEIRGAGDLLGRRQHGNIQAIGFEAYARILGEAVAELRGDPISREHDPELSFDIPAFLPDTYVEDTGQRLDFYRRMSGARDPDEVREVLAELHDRFGELPIEARHFGLLMVAKTYARRVGAHSLELTGSRCTLRVPKDAPVDASALLRRAKVSLESATSFRIAGPERLNLDLPLKTGEDCARQLQAIESALVELVTGTGA
jgi:transcription-repair coupling factor (superfamily II helicase)